MKIQPEGNGRARSIILLGALGAVLGVFLAAGCSNEEVFRQQNGEGPQVDAAALEHTETGWGLFEAGDYEGALSSFAAAITIEPSYTDALSGQGWSYLRLDSLTLAASSFDSAAAYGVYWQDNLAYTGALMGQAFTAAAQEDYVLAAAAGALATELAGEFYRFPHDDSITVDHARLVVAEAYTRLGYYHRAYLQLVEIDITVLDRVDPDSGLFIQQLLEELSRQSLSL